MQEEEQERLRKIQQALEAERHQKELEERRIREEEEYKRLYVNYLYILMFTLDVYVNCFYCRKAEMEARRKQEEAERLKQEEEDRRSALALQAQLRKETEANNKYRELLEQERRDHELAMRLANETNGQVEESPPMLRKYVQNKEYFKLSYKMNYMIQ